MTSSKNLRPYMPAASLVLFMLLAACGAGGGGSSSGSTAFYEPVSSSTSGSTYVGLWLVSSDKPASVPVQVTDASIDLPDFGVGPAFYDWTYDPSTRERTGMLPRFFAYGSGGHIFGVSLAQPAAARQLSSGTYARLCSAQAVQAGPYSSAKSYVVAQVSMTGSAGPCDTTWIIPTDATSGTPPITPAQPVSFLAGLKDPDSGLVTGFLMSTGGELDVYSPTDMTKISTLLSGLPAGAQVSLASFTSPLTSAQGVVVETATSSVTPGATSLKDDVYLASASRALLVGSYTLPASPACNVSGQSSFVQGVASDSSLLYVVPAASGGAGFTVRSVPLAGGTPTTVYTDTADCRALPDAVVDGRLVLQESSSTVSVDATGASGQTPVTLATGDGINDVAFVNYEIGSDAWVVDYTLDPVSGDIADITTKIIDLTSGHVLKTYAHSTVMGDFWKGFNANGSVSRGPVFVARGTTTSSCRLLIDSIDAIDPETFASSTTSVSGTPCEGSTFGPAPLALNSYSSTNLHYISKPAGGVLSFGKVQLTAGAALTLVLGTPVY